MFDGIVSLGFCVGVLIFLAIGVVFRGLRLLYEYERGVVFTLGKFTGIRESGIDRGDPGISKHAKG